MPDAPAPELSRHDDDLADLLNRPWPAGLSDRVRFDHSKGVWHVREKDGTIWFPDRKGGVYELVRERALAYISAENVPAADRKTLTAFFDRGKKESVLKSLATRPGIAMTGEEWDPEPHLMAFTNGVLDLRDLSFTTEPHPEWLITRSTHQAWKPEGDLPVGFIGFLKQIMGGDRELADYLASVLGYAMFGWQREQKFWMWVGQGQNGKGTLAKVVTHALGDYAATPSAELYMKTRFGSSRSDAPRPDLIKLQGVRFAWMSEPAGGQFNEEMLKAHTGDDPITARDLFSKAFQMVTFRPSHTIAFLTNDPPRTEDVGLSMRRRVRVIRFEQDFTGDKEDKELETKLKREAPGILVLLAAFAQRWYEAGGLTEPAQVTEWSNAYIEENDPLSQFVAEACVVDRTAATSGVLLYGAYRDWCAKRDGEPMSQTGFGMALGKRYIKTHSRTGAKYVGIKPKSAVEEAEDET